MKIRSKLATGAARLAALAATVTAVAAVAATSAGVPPLYAASDAEQVETVGAETAAVRKALLLVLIAEAKHGSVSVESPSTRQ